MSKTTCSGIITPSLSKDLTGSIRYLLPNTGAYLLDKHSKEVTVNSESRELHLSGLQIILRYWKNEQARQESKTRDRWLKTSNVAVTRNGK